MDTGEEAVGLRDGVRKMMTVDDLVAEWAIGLGATHHRDCVVLSVAANGGE
jgi:hypothetical protein